MRDGWCRHFTGLIGTAGEPRDVRRCKAGVLYVEVTRLPVPGRGYQLPCIGDPDMECSLYDPVTPEQEQADEQKALERLRLHGQVVQSGHCPHCGQRMTSQRVGRCSYAQPCGHRLNEIPRIIRGLEHV